MQVCREHGLVAGEANLSRFSGDISNPKRLHASLNVAAPAEVEASHADRRNRR